ncbi:MULTISPECIES: SDR family NAD(P)-dependent oxidoreductase [Thermus]|jgi:NAD(P)-dependent dehydrogenase (short-subunit alcohol dehydrogenase family)|uniref:3-hydroxyacyl-CoA dehydrogenase n=1 Tax=Thermus brockianus TaxID=56956 RepID=A0A1J0LS04_THEBO|nr:SDR family NAD(P)-dependent oxidoreductase [Thermus brockianus]APD08507.1 type II 3-hydroxyacyl-CoA dehydrogenase [Thermus brockianus]BDG16143.1 3-hydroxyacyl-CoA dehydrogenase [Thermus brockianus]
MERSALVTGGASGLGRAAALALKARGYRVVVLDLKRGEEDLPYVEGDVREAADVARAVALAEEAGPLFAVVNAAGIGLAQKILGREGPHDLEAFRKVVEVNLVGTFNVLRLAAWAMRENPPDGEGQRGVIVNTASVAAYEGQIGQAAYAASKGGVVALTLPAARELAEWGIRVVTIAPGLFDTPLLQGLPEKAKASLAAQVPFPRRLGRPEEYALLVLHILENPMLNGEVVRLDGALRMAPR